MSGWDMWARHSPKHARQQVLARAGLVTPQYPRFRTQDGHLVQGYRQWRAFCATVSLSDLTAAWEWLLHQPVRPIEPGAVVERRFRIEPGAVIERPPVTGPMERESYLDAEMKRQVLIGGKWKWVPLPPPSVRVEERPKPDRAGG